MALCRPAASRRPVRAPLAMPAALVICGSIVGAFAAVPVTTPQAAIAPAGSSVATGADGPWIPTRPAGVLRPDVRLVAETGWGSASPASTLDVRPGPVFEADAMRVFFPASFSARLLSFMEREALRYRRGNVVPAFETYGPTDMVFEEARSRQAGRILTRSFKKTARLELERLSRASDGFGEFLDRIAGTGGSEPSTRIGGGARPGERPGLDGTVRLRIDAHPRLVVGAGFLGGRGRIDVPLRNDPLRISFERPLGAHGRAVLSSGLRRDGSGTTSLTLSFAF